MRSNDLTQRAKRVWIPLLISIILALTSCTATNHASYLDAIDEYNKTIASHEVARVDLNPDGTVSSIVFSGQPRFIAPTPEANPILEGMKIVVPLASRLIDPSGVVVPVLKAGNDIVYNMDSNNTSDTDTSSIVTDDYSDSDSTITDSHDDNSSTTISPEVTP